MMEYWETSYKEMQTAWGFEPSDSAIFAMNFFLDQKINNILIPGIGYGRNAKVFVDNGFNVTGIEISKTAIDLAKNNLDIKIYHGSVINMPYDKYQYDGIFCYALIQLLNFQERKKFIKNCYNQLKSKGYMVFTVVSKKSMMYGRGKYLSKDRFEILKGLRVFYYDFESVKKEFAHFGLIEAVEIDEPIKHMKNEPPLKCILVKCKKAN